MTPSEKLVSEVALCLRRRACEERGPDSDLLVEFGGWGDDEDFLSLAQAAIAIVVEKAAEVARGFADPAQYSGAYAIAADDIANALLALSNQDSGL